MAAEPRDFMILDMDSGNAVGSYTSETHATSAFVQLLRDFPDEAHNLALVIFDKTGEALETRLASDFTIPA
jgi:hypothetical protein